VRVFIGVNVRTCMSICVCTVFLKKAQRDCVVWPMTIHLRLSPADPPPSHAHNGRCGTWGPYDGEPRSPAAAPLARCCPSSAPNPEHAAAAAQELATVALSSAGGPPPSLNPPPWRLLSQIRATPRRKPRCWSPHSTSALAPPDALSSVSSMRSRSATSKREEETSCKPTCHVCGGIAAWKLDSFGWPRVGWSRSRENRRRREES
jgi:hypothetical protein